MLETIAIASIAVFGLAAIYYFLWFMSIDKTRLYIKQCTRYSGGKTKKRKAMFAYSRRMLFSVAMALFILCVASVALLLEHGFFVRPDAVVIWWARYVAYTLALPLLVFHVATFLWHFHYDRIAAMLCAAAFWVLMGLMASFAYDSLQWVYFALAMVPLLALAYVAYLRRQRRDNVGGMAVAAVVIALGFYVANWVLSPPAADVLSMEVGFWIYFGLDVVAYVLLPHYLLTMHIDKWTTEEYRKIADGKQKLRAKISLKHSHSFSQSTTHHSQMTQQDMEVA